MPIFTILLTNHGGYTEMIEGRILDKGYKAVSSNNSVHEKCDVLQFDIWYDRLVNCNWVDSRWQ
jgi:hypothetical protein